MIYKGWIDTLRTWPLGVQSMLKSFAFKLLGFWSRILVFWTYFIIFFTFPIHVNEKIVSNRYLLHYLPCSQRLSILIIADSSQSGLHWRACTEGFRRREGEWNYLEGTCVLCIQWREMKSALCVWYWRFLFNFMCPGGRGVIPALFTERVRIVSANFLHCIC